MHVHRIQVAATIGWLFLLFNIERIYEPINLASFVYALAAVGGMLMLLFRPLREAALYRPIGVALAVHIIIKCLLGYAISTENLLLTFTEAMAIAVTMGLAAVIGRNTDRFTQATHDLALMHRPDALPSVEEAEPAFHREIRRARRHGRPLSLVTLRPLPESLLQARPRFAVRLERELTGRYLFGLMADALLKGTKSDDLIARSADGFTLLLPETSREQAEQLAARLAGLCSVVLGIETRTIVAGFPDDELTMSGLLARTGTPPDRDQSRPNQDVAVGATALLHSV
jgi:hypothetical protein